MGQDTTRRRVCWTGIALLALFALLASVASADDHRGGEVGFIGGLSGQEFELTGDSGLSPSFGLRGGSVFSRHFGWNIDLLYARVDADPALDFAEVLTARTGIDFLFTPEKRARWFVNLGGGLTDVTFDKGNADYDYPFASVGAGQRWMINDVHHFRWELRADTSLDDEGPMLDSLNRVHGLISLSWGPQGKGVDTDGDGVADRRDLCPGTPNGAVVDERGCPKDGDADKVFDGIDRCPETPKGWPVDASGCNKDSDGDAVPDGADDCPDTPQGAKVDDKGCPTDADGDGVFDGIDTCPDTPSGATVDRTGCPKDSDGDGVFDGIDKCLNTPAGAEVDSNGCPKDSDGDRVFDGLDKCPDTPAGTEVDAEGCPVKKLFEPGQRTLVLEGVNFATNEAVLTPDSTGVLDRVTEALLDWPDVRVEVGGHTDSTGADEYNLELSKRRAATVRDYMIGKGVPAAQLESRGYGEGSPVGDNKTREGRATNRRVELKKLN